MSYDEQPDGDPHGECAAEIRQLNAELAELRTKLEEANTERAWVRRKLKLPEDCGFLTGRITLAGTMHNICADAHGYQAYITTNKCNDKLGEIAKLARRAVEAERKLTEAERRGMEKVDALAELNQKQFLELEYLRPIAYKIWESLK